jgi:hypothetical protein
MTSPLHAASQTELDHGSLTQQIGSLALSDWERYDGSMRVVMDYVALADRGEPPPEDEWHRALHELADDRRVLANNAEVVLRGQITDWEQHLAANRHDLGQVIAALEDVEKAVRDNEDATHLAHLVLKLKDLAEFAEHPSVGKAAHVVGIGNTGDHLIEQGIENLANYQYLVVLASHGVGSKEELQRRVESANQQVIAAAQALHQLYYLRDVAEQAYAIPAPT